jgi:ribosomal protein S18 acetylase RimI-like enzyme
MEESNSSPAGILIAGYNTNKAINEFIKKNIFPVFLTLFRNPQFISEKIIGLIKKIITEKKEVQTTNLQLYLIEIDPACRRKGFAKELISHFEKELKKDKIYYYGLSVRKTNEEAIQFYNKNNFKVEHTDRISIHYLREILES